MNSKTDVSGQSLLFKLIKLAFWRLLNSYDNNIFNDSKYAPEKVKEILEILELSVNEIDRLTNEE